MEGPALRQTSERSSHKRGALVAIAVAADLTWVSVHIPALAAIGLVEGDPRFYAAYQTVRCAIAGAALTVALRSGLFGRREIGLVGARHLAAVCWLAQIVGVAWLVWEARTGGFREAADPGGHPRADIGSFVWVSAGLLVNAALIGAVIVGGALLVAPATACELARRSLAVPTVYPWDIFVRDLLCMVAVAPLYEEVLYRALLLSALRDRLREQAALIVSGGVFVVLHYTYGYGWHVGYLAAALLFGLVFLRTGSIAPAIALHALNNLWFVLSSHARSTLGDAAVLGWFCPP